MNQDLRQSAPMTLALWGLDELFRKIEVRERVTWDYLGEKVRIPIADGPLPARTQFLFFCADRVGIVRTMVLE